MFFPLCRSNFLTYIIFFLSEVLLLTHLVRQIYWQQILSVLVCLIKYLFLLPFWKIVSVIQNSKLVGCCCFLSTSKYFTLPSSCWHEPNPFLCPSLFCSVPARLIPIHFISSLLGWFWKMVAHTSDRKGGRERGISSLFHSIFFGPYVLYF